MNKQITVASRANDPLTRRVAKYSNDEEWNTPDGAAPNGVAAFRALRDTSPDVAQLTQFAKWLIETLPSHVAGNYSDGACMCCSNMNVYEWELSNDQNRANSLREFYGMNSFLSEPKAFDWHFSIINNGQSDEDYWNREAAKIASARDVDYVVVGGQRFNIEK